MVQIEINPQALGDWEEITNTTKTALLDESGKFLRIPAFPLNVSNNSRFIAVQVTSTTAKSNWIAGGYIAQLYKFPSFNTTLKSHYLKLNSTNLVELHENQNYNYDLIFYPRSYFQDVSIKVWKYQGEEIDFLKDILSEIQTTVANNDSGNNIDLSEIITKLDNLSQNLDNSYLGLTDDLSNLVEQLTTLQTALSGIDADVILQLNQIDTGIFTLFEALKNLIPESEIFQLETNLRTRLDLQEEFL